MLAQQNKEVKAIRRPKTIRIGDEELIKKFNEFYENEWQSKYAYTPKDFIIKFDINRHLARYYLMNMVWDKRLFRVKYANKTYYMMRDDVWIDKFSQLLWFGVEVSK